MNPPARVPVAAALVLAGAILAGEQIAATGLRMLMPVAIGAFVAAWVVRGAPRGALVLAGSLLAGLALGARADASSHWPATVGFGPAEIAAVLTDDPSGHPYAASVLARTERVDGTELHRTVLVRASGGGALRLRALRAGDHVVLRGRLAALDDANVGDAFALQAGAVARLDAAVIDDFRAPASLHLRAGAAVRRRIEAGAGKLESADDALLRGFLLGDTRDVERATIDAFRAAGLTHLLAVSGANVAFVLALAGPLMRRTPTVARFAIGAAVVLVFAAATRFEPSVLRASAMAGVVMVARLSGRSVSGARALAYAVFVLLLRDAALVHSVGFRLSVAATAGIVIGASRLGALLPGPVLLRDALGVTLAAEVAVAPLLVAEFGSVPLVAPLANLFAVPVAEPLTIYGLVAAAVAPSLPPRLAAAAMAPCGWLLAWVRAVAQVAASVPFALDARGLAAAALIGVAAWWRRARR